MVGGLMTTPRHYNVKKVIMHSLICAITVHIVGVANLGSIYYCHSQKD